MKKVNADEGFVQVILWPSWKNYIVVLEEDEYKSWKDIADEVVADEFQNNSTDDEIIAEVRFIENDSLRIERLEYTRN